MNAPAENHELVLVGAAFHLAALWKSATQGTRANVRLETAGLAAGLDDLVSATARYEPPDRRRAPRPAGRPTRVEVTVVVDGDHQDLDEPPAPPAAVVPHVEAPVERPRPADTTDDVQQDIPAEVAARRVLSAAGGLAQVAESVWGPKGPRPTSPAQLAAICRRARRLASHAAVEPDREVEGEGPVGDWWEMSGAGEYQDGLEGAS